ncbi:MAG: cytochrome c3 family protein [Byssovorax sp.]
MIKLSKLGTRGAIALMLLSLTACGADGKQGDPGPAGQDGTAGPTGATGATGADGPVGPKGDTGEVPSLKNDITGSVHAGATPLAGVSLTADPGGATAMTGADGKFTLPDMDIGGYLLSVHLDGFLDQTIPVAVNLSGPTNLSIDLAIDPEGQGPTVSVSDQLVAGFGQPVTIKATATGLGNLTYSWTQTEGPTVDLAGASTDTLGFVTQTLMTAKGQVAIDNARFGMLGVNPDEAGNHVFELTVTDEVGHKTTTTVHVNAARPTLGLRNVPVGIRVFAQGDGKLATPAQASWSWTLDKTKAPGSAASLTDAATQFPSFTPDVVGTYTLTETVSGKSMKVYAGTWLGEMTDAAQGTCSLCHNDSIAPNKFTPWKGTNHYSALQQKIDGVYGQGFKEECLSCHTVGYDKSAQNGGFDDLEAGSGWSFPGTLQPGNYADLMNNAKLGPLAGIQCESCHGPQIGPQNGPHANANFQDKGARISWSSDVCASCHQENPYHYKPQQWAQGKHADMTLAVLEGTVENRGTTAAHCGRCHTAQGFAQYARQLSQGYTGQLTSDGKPALPGNPSPNAATIDSLTALGLTKAEVQSQTCAACHDPHDATNPAQLRIYDTVAGLPNGMGQITGAGTGMICASCHNTRNGEHSDFVAAPSSYSAPHAAAQADVVYGFNAYYVNRYNPSPHLAVADTCAGCHYKAVTASNQEAKQTSNHSFMVDNTLCANCHAANINGEALQAVYAAQVASLGTAIGNKVKGLIATALLPANGGAFTVRGWDPVTDYYSSAAASNVQINTLPVSVELFEVHGQVGFILTMAAPIQFPLVDVQGNPAGQLETNKVYLQSSSLKNAAGAAALFPANSDYLKASWNYFLLHGDNTKGVHNPPFYNAVLAATNAKVAALP